MRYLLRKRYLVLSFVVITLMISNTINGQWIGDFWEHSAVVRELATNPFSPKHPELLLDAPHAFYSPYALGVAWISRITGLSPVKTLSIVGIINLLLFLTCLRLFVSLFFNSKSTSFYTLLFTLVLWGPFVWWYSGFFHLNVLGYVLPYPSTFATALIFLSFSVYILFSRSGNLTWVFPLLALNIVVLLTHPISAIAMDVGLIALWVGSPSPRSRHNYALLLCVIPLSFIVATAWPYFSLVDLISSQSPEFHESNRVMYNDVIKRIFPALIGLPLLMLRIKSNWRDPLGMMFFGLFLIYIYGAISANFSYGRIIFHFVFVLHLVTADWITRTESKLASGQFTSPLYRYLHLFIILLVIISAISFIPGLIRSVPGRQNSYEKYIFLSTYTKQYDVILSDIDTSWIVPTFGGKVIASLHPLAFVKDHEERKEDLKRFFSVKTTHSERLEIIKKYRVNFLLLNRGRVIISPAMMRSFNKLGNIVYSNNSFILINMQFINNLTERN